MERDVFGKIFVLLPGVREPEADRGKALGKRRDRQGVVSEIFVAESVFDGAHGEVQGFIELIAGRAAVLSGDSGLVLDMRDREKGNREDGEHG